ncbi:histidine phosphotransferase family protein [Limibaculum sp. FT325]|uniref:histidine phosphotransferase family protein n=1 Tax=Thermohalobaculum sediminis TaxID=2939436 RepID=UPI0020BE1127|nr:histidine phosphotransferase family protein [Limibaculum sediminis]MCL5775713.1 histidine phosphotransferase family protein [Limibaculum sediminis]
MNESALAEIVAARICHDLVSPVGAIGNAADLIDELSHADIGEELSLIRDSSARAASMLRLHRLAFGTAGDGGGMARDALQRTVGAVLEDARVTMRWTGLEGPPLRLAAARGVALMALAGRCLLGMRGRISVTMALDTAWPVGVAAEGEGAALDADAEAWLAGLPMQRLPEPRRVELALLAPVLRGAGARLAVRSAPGLVLVTALPN